MYTHSDTLHVCVTRSSAIAITLGGKEFTTIHQSLPLLIPSLEPVVPMAVVSKSSDLAATSTALAIEWEKTVSLARSMAFCCSTELSELQEMESFTASWSSSPSLFPEFV